jgi:hypothetical protein
LQNTYKVLSNFLPSRLNIHAEIIIEFHRCGNRRDNSTTDIIFCVLQLLEKKWEYNEALHQPYMDLKKLKIQLEGMFCMIFSLRLVTPLKW